MSRIAFDFAEVACDEFVARIVTLHKNCRSKTPKVAHNDFSCGLDLRRRNYCRCTVFVRIGSSDGIGDQ